MGEKSLKRCLGLRETLTITAGTVIGVGLFTVGANVVGLLGPYVIFATFAAMAISIYPALLYAEMGAALPYAGGTYQYAAIGLGRGFGMLAGWCFVISMVSVASGEALAFSFYIRTLLGAMGVQLPVSDAIIACTAVAAFVLLGIRGTHLTGRLQNGFMFFFWGVTAVWVVSILPHLHLGSFAAGTAVADMSAAGFLPCVAMIWWCFAGFETCCAMGEEIRYPHINLPRALILAPLLVFAVNGLFQWALVCLVPADSLTALAGSAAPYADGMRTAGVIGFPLILLCAGIAFGGDFSTLNASITAPARYLYTMARDGVLPRSLARLHPRRRTPWVATLLPGALMLVLAGTGSIGYIASLSLFATLVYYVIGIAAACGLRRRQPSLARPFRAPLLGIGAPVSAAIYLLMITQLDPGAVAAGAVWCAIGLAVFWLCRRKYGPQGLPETEALRAVVPPPAERARMDKEYRIWRAAVVAAAVLVAALFGVSFALA